MTKVATNQVAGEIKVFCHRVSWWYDLPDGWEVTDELRTLLEEEAESRAKTCIVDDCSSGELNYVYRGETEIRGWWKIERA